MSFGVKEARKEARLDKNQRHAESTNCGICGEEISRNKLFCDECRATLSLEVAHEARFS